MRRSFIKSSNAVLLFNYTGRLLSGLIVFYFLPKFLSIENIGIYAGIHHMVFFLARLSLSQGVIRYGALLRADRERKGYFLGWVWLASTFFYTLVLGTLFFINYYFADLFSFNSPVVVSYLPFVMFLGYIVLMNVTMKAWYIALGKAVWPNFCQHVILQLFLIILIFGHGKGLFSFDHFLVATALPYIFNLGCLLVELWRRGEFYLASKGTFFDKSLIYPFISYSFFTLFSSGITMLMMRIDNLMVLKMCGVREIALYHTVSFMIFLLEVPMKVVKQTSASKIVQLLERADKGALERLYKEATRWQFFLTSFLFIVLYTYIDYLLVAFSSELIAVMKLLFLLLGLAKLLGSIFRMGNELLMLSNYFKWSCLIGSSSLFLGIFLNYYLIRSQGIYGASIATGITLLLGGALSSGIVWYRWGIHPGSISLFYGLLFTICLLVVVGFLPSFDPSWSDFLLRTLFLVIAYAAPWVVHKIYFL